MDVKEREMIMIAGELQFRTATCMEAIELTCPVTFINNLHIRSAEWVGDYSCLFIYILHILWNIFLQIIYGYMDH